MDRKLATDYEQKIEASCTESLTGLYTHGFFQFLLDNEINRSNRYGSFFTVALINIDGFELYNQRYGSLKGDEMLRNVAKLILTNIRNTDLPARYGGDTFSVIFPETSSILAQPALTRILMEVEALSSKAITVSVGFAEYPREAKSKHSLTSRTIEALKEAKLRGRNQSFFFTSDGPDDSTQETTPPIVLVIDDEPLNVKLMQSLLSANNYHVLTAHSGAEAIKILGYKDVDLIYMDVMMPGMDGFEACRRIKTYSGTRMIPVVLLTALDDLDSKVKGIDAGADDFISKPPKSVEILAKSAALIKVKQLNNNLTNIENVLFSLANAVETKDPYTQGHIRRVSDLAALLGRRRGFSKARIDALRFGGILHDIGKIGIPRTILNKPGPLSDEEWKIMKTHPALGYRICVPLEKTLGPALAAILHHHEKLDGSGYPDGLRGDAISIDARIMAVADIYDALTTNRRYRKAMTATEALRIQRQEANENKLDVSIVEDLAEIINSNQMPLQPLVNTSIPCDETDGGIFIPPRPVNAVTDYHHPLERGESDDVKTYSRD